MDFCLSGELGDVNARRSESNDYVVHWMFKTCAEDSF